MKKQLMILNIEVKIIILNHTRRPHGNDGVVKQQEKGEKR